MLGFEVAFGFFWIAIIKMSTGQVFIDVKVHGQVNTAVKIVCEAGQYIDLRGSDMSTCTRCDTNSISEAGATVCTVCDAGTVANEYNTECGEY